MSFRTAGCIAPDAAIGNPFPSASRNPSGPSVRVGTPAKCRFHPNGFRMPRAGLDVDFAKAAFPVEETIGTGIFQKGLAGCRGRGDGTLLASPRVAGLSGEAGGVCVTIAGGTVDFSAGRRIAIPATGGEHGRAGR